MVPLYQLAAISLGISLGLAVPLQSDGGRGGGTQVSRGEASSRLAQPATGQQVPVDDARQWRYMGEMQCTGYCKNACCCGKWAKFGRFADGSEVSEKTGVSRVLLGLPRTRGEGNQRTPRIVSADPIYPFNTRLWVEGVGECVVRDRGGAIKGNKLDLYTPEGHEAALKFGRASRKVWRLEALPRPLHVVSQQAVSRLSVR